MSAEQKALTVIERAVVAIGKKEREAELVKLASATTDITTITNADGYKQVHAARMALKNERLEITKACETARQDAKDFQKAVIAEEKRLIGLIQPEEARLETLQDAWDAAREQERQARIYAEVRRVASLQERLAILRGCPTLCASSGSVLICDHIQDLEEIVVDDTFQEFRQQAEDAKAAGLARLRELHAAALAHEAEQERIRLEREELARLRAECAELEAAERARLAEEARRAREIRDREEAEALTRRQAEEAERRRQQELIEAQSRAAREQIAAEERQARARQQAESERIVAEEKAAKARQEAEDRRLAEERARFEQEQAEARKAQESEHVVLSGVPTASDIVEVLAIHYDESPETVLDWLRGMSFCDFSLEGAFDMAEASAQ